jgi:hypothetical protein
LAINHPFKQFYSEHWDSWFDNQSEKKRKKNEKASRSTVARWIGKSWSTVTKDTVLNSWSVYNNHQNIRLTPQLPPPFQEPTKDTTCHQPQVHIPTNVQVPAEVQAEGSSPPEENEWFDEEESDNESDCSSVDSKFVDILLRDDVSMQDEIIFTDEHA